MRLTYYTPVPGGVGPMTKERRQAQAIRKGKKLREQFQLDDYLVRRSTDPTYTFRQHLRNIGGAGEE